MAPLPRILWPISPRLAPPPLRFRRRRGNLIIGGQIVFAIAGTNNSALAGSNGYRLALNTSSLVFNPLLGTNPPSISALPDVTVVANQDSTTNSFTLTDPDGDSANFNSGNVTAASSDLTGAIITGVTILGSGANEMIYVTAGGTPGTATVEVTATDELGDQAQRTFNVTVVPQIFPPTISTPPNTNTFVNTPVVVPFTIGDPSEAVSTLTVSATVDPVSQRHTCRFRRESNRDRYARHKCRRGRLG